MRVRLVLVVLLATTALAGCGTFARSYDPAGVDELTIPTPSPRPADFVAAVDNPWLPLRDGASWTYTVTRPGVAEAVRTVTVLPGRVAVAGVRTTAVRSVLAGEPAAEATDYYAQDRRGNVWWLGHTAAAGSWRAGESGAQAGLAMAARPRVGDGYRTAYLRGVVEDVATVAQRDGDQVQVDVTSALEPGGVTRLVYRRDVGLVSRIDAVSGEYDALRR